MEENRTRYISQEELAALLETMPDNMVIKVVFGEEEKDGEGKRFCTGSGVCPPGPGCPNTVRNKNPNFRRCDPSGGGAAL